MMHARKFKTIGMAGAVALGALLLGAPAQAQDDSVEGSSVWNLEQRVWGGIVRGLGLKDPNTPAIEYRERSPLVVPPARDLPPPQARAKPRDGAWPKDPDVAKATKSTTTKRRSNAATAIENQGRPLSPAELDPQGVPRGQTVDSGRSNVPQSGADGAPLAPSELGYFGGLFSKRAWGFGSWTGYQNETGTFTNEPARTELTEPPPGYQTPSVAQPYGVTRRVETTKPEQFDPAGREHLSR